MKSNQTMFFIVREDIAPLVKAWEETIDVCYYKTGMFDTKEVKCYNSFLDVPDFGKATAGDWNQIDNYMVLNKNTPLIIREVPQRSGGTKYAVDPQLNPISISIKLGGVLHENVIVAGRVGTVSDDDVSSLFYKTISSKIKKEFKLIDSFYVSKEAQRCLLEGWRLVTNEKLSLDFDLTI